MSLHSKTLSIIDTAKEILSSYHPMTVRQLYYQLVSRHIIENSKNSYGSVCNALVNARKQGIISWDWIEDRLRRPRTVSMWDNLSDFSETVVSAYRRNVWSEQGTLVEVWLEKDALSGIFEDILEYYGITLNVGRGYDGWTSIYQASSRYAGDDVIILYFGDFDPSGEDMVRSLRERLAFFQARPEIIKIALTHDDIKTYELPPDFTKKTDTRSKGFITKHGDISVELDALPVDILKNRLIRSVENYLDLETLEKVKQLEHEDKIRIKTMLKGETK